MASHCTLWSSHLRHRRGNAEEAAEVVSAHSITIPTVMFCQEVKQNQRIRCAKTHASLH